MTTAMQREMFDLFKTELELCGVKSGVNVAVLSEGDQLQDYAATFIAAGRELGATVANVHLPAANAASASERIANVGQNSLSQHPEAMKTCKQADLVIDHMLLLFSREQIEMQKAGARVILVVEPIEILKRLAPTKAQRKRVEAAEARLKRAKTLRFINDAGTDVTYGLGDKEVLTEYGYTDTPGRWDHWPGGFLATLAHNGQVNGRVVMQPKDIIYPLKSFVKKGIEFTIRDGLVVEMTGPDAAVLKMFIDTYEDPRAYAISHIGWGLNEKCKWRVDLPGIGMDGRAHYGNVLFSLGPDTEFGGDNDTACHLDLPMRHCTLYLDDEIIVEHGKVIPADMCAPGH
ncbi:MAG: leucyl aminopeptidase [Alphaproteobacteria bacterium]|nr:leucyl aminopeptidase [Alphaproteobacteria bacterium]